MKKTLFVLLLLAVYIPVSYGQPVTHQNKGNPRAAKKLNFENDEIYKRLKSVIPPGWSISYKGRELIIEKNEAVWILFENRINAPPSAETAEERAERIKKFGKQGKSRLVFSFEEKWPAEKLEKVKTENALTMSKIKALPQKYRISHLLDKSQAVKGGEYYKAAAPGDEEKIKGYLKEKNRLEKKIKKIPDYHTSAFSLFFTGQSGQEDEFHLVYPERSQAELYFIKSRLEEILEK